MMETINAYNARYESLLETLILLSVSGLKESIVLADEEIARGETFPMADILGVD